MTRGYENPFADELAAVASAASQEVNLDRCDELVRLRRLESIVKNCILVSVRDHGIETLGDYRGKSLFLSEDVLKQLNEAVQP